VEEGRNDAKSSQYKQNISFCAIGYANYKGDKPPQNTYFAQLAWNPLVNISIPYGFENFLGV
jgi:hypothetical protein